MNYIIEEGVCFWFLLQKGKRFVKVVVCVCVYVYAAVDHM